MRGRSVQHYERIYIDGYDMSMYVGDTGEQGADIAEAEYPCFADVVNGALCGKPKPVFGPVQGVFDNTPTSGIHVLADAAQGTRRYITHPRGVMAAPGIGDDVFCAPMLQMKYKAVGTALVTAKMEFSADASFALNYGKFFGALLHPFATGGVNSSNANADNGAASAAGGWMMYHIYSITGAGTATISIDESSTGSSAWAALSGATTAAIATAAAPTSGIVQLATNAAVKQYLRPQVVFGGAATAVIYALSFIRG